jgi:hypothetical protein
VTSLSEIKAKAKQFAANIGEAAARYAETDQTLESRVNQQQFDPNGSQGQPGSAGGAAGAGSSAGAGLSAGNPIGQMGEMLSTPMEMAGQAVQMPMQTAGMLGSIPQGLMQGMQSIPGIAGQFGHPGQFASATANDLSATELSPGKPEGAQATPEEKPSEPAEPRHQAAGPQREQLEPLPDSLGDGAAGGHLVSPTAPVAPLAPVRPVAPPTEIDL